MNDFPSAQLYVAREFAQLEPAEGIVVGADALPPKLQQPLWRDEISPPIWEDICYNAISNRSWLRKPGQDLADAGWFLSQTLPDFGHGVVQTPAVWSGDRSHLVMDDEKLYRLKGTNYGHVVHFVDGRYVLGGQLTSEAEHEREGFILANTALAKQGIAPTATPVGWYQIEVPTAYMVKPKFSFSREQAWEATGTTPLSLETTIYRVTGDTRADELFATIEQELMGAYWNQEIPESFREQLATLYFRIGFAGGSQLRALHRAGLTWSDDPVRTNAHLGNLVITPHENGVSVGMVDFDRFLSPTVSKSRMRHQRKVEYETLFDSGFSREISTRTLFSAQEKRTPQLQFRGFYAGGVERGYKAKSPIADVEVELASIIDTVFELQNTDPSLHPIVLTPMHRFTKRA